MDAAAIEWITGRLVAAVRDARPVDPIALTFLLRRHAAPDHAEVQDVLESALADGLARHGQDAGIGDRSAWLTLFVDALAMSADERLLDAAAALVESLRREWGRTADVEGTAVSVDAALHACAALDPASIAPQAVDELERIVSLAYEPGEGLAHAGGGDDRGELADHIMLASALLTAHDISGRLPYSMLAEELLQFARRVHWSDPAGCFEVAGLDRWEMFRLNCESARVLRRLAALHGDDDYRAAAVIHPGAGYADDMRRILSAQEPLYRPFGARSAIYGLALSEALSE